jgi:8-oxo-dGTP pyrophosphatase MutT (NUDIX family)
METFAAGIIPYTFKDNQIYYLLGLEASNNKWSGFVGGSEPGETVQQTAIREFNEETCMIFKAVPLILGEPVIETSSTGKTVYLYFVKLETVLPDETVLNKFFDENKRIYKQREYHEKKKLQWFSLPSLKKSNKILNKLKKMII